MFNYGLVVFFFFLLFNEFNELFIGWKWEYELFLISWEEFEYYVGFIEVD